MKKTLHDFTTMKRNRTPITWITSYNYPQAQAAEAAGIDMILIGDSGGMVELGYSTTNPVTMDEMITFAKAVRRGAPNTFIVGDMPQGAYEASPEDAVNNALRFIKEAGCDAIKLEGGTRMKTAVTAIVNAGITVIGHLGLTPQSTVSFGGYRVQGKTPETLCELRTDTLALEEYGCSMILIEAVPEVVGEYLSKLARIPIMGIGAGLLTDGQLIILHDLAGYYKAFRPHFAKCYIPDAIQQLQAKIDANLAAGITLKQFGKTTRQDGVSELLQIAIEKYVEEVRAKTYPTPDYVYPLKAEELESLLHHMK
jgi:3-methyl-2-oxobutanoate hydroxymethyltransferase